MSPDLTARRSYADAAIAPFEGQLDEPTLNQTTDDLLGADGEQA